MSSNQLVSRQAGSQLTPRQAPPQTFSEALERARVVATSGVVPRDYTKPGAVLLAQDYAERHDLPLMTVIQNVSFINGKPFLSAELWQEFAKRAGKRVQIVGTVTEKDGCLARVTDAATGEMLGEWRSTIANDAVASNKNWRDKPLHMLRASAIRNACRFYAEVGVIGAVDNDDQHEILDPVDVIAEQPQPQVEVDPEPEDEGDIVEAEVVEYRDFRGELSAAGIKQAEALKAAQMLAPDAHITSASKFEGHEDLFDRILGGEGIE